MNVCLVSDFSLAFRLREFKEAILEWHPDCRFVDETGKPDAFYVDMWQPEYADYATKHYRKPTYLIGYSAIQNNPKVFRREVKTNENKN